MPSNLPRFTLRTSQEYIDKIAYIAEKECRTTTKEIEYLIIREIQEYEAKYGEIRLQGNDLNTK